jgi:mono/diheme cytochrome c family protein
MNRSRSAPSFASRARRTALACLTSAGMAVAAIGTTGSAADAQDAAPATLAPLTFTDTQARQGRAVFGGTCAGCHGDNLAGLEGPPLKGDVFARWFEGPVADLFNFIMSSMPADRPGTLSPQRTAQILAYILDGNGFVAGDVALPDDPAVLAGMGFVQE